MGELTKILNNCGQEYELNWLKNFPLLFLFLLLSLALEEACKHSK